MPQLQDNSIVRRGQGGVRGCCIPHSANADDWNQTFDTVIIVSEVGGLYMRRGAMGNIRRLAAGEAAPSGLPDVHGVAHRLKPVDLAKLTDMEHEYRCRQQRSAAYLAASAGPVLPHHVL